MRDPSNEDLCTPCKWPAEVTLVPNSGIQILDFGFDLSAVGAQKLSFVERMVEPGTDGAIQWQLVALSGDEDTDKEQLGGGVQADDKEFTINATKAIEPFLNKWVPVPVLRRGVGGSGALPEEVFDQGPTTWARMRIKELAPPDPATGHTHRVQLALDTSLADNIADEETYLAPMHADAQGKREFRFCSKPKHTTWFLHNRQSAPNGSVADTQEWVSGWLYDCFLSFKQAQRPNRPVDPEQFEFQLEHWARYLAYLALVDEAVEIPLLKFVDTVHPLNAVKPVDVDFVLDIGNSRSCGILIETFPDQRRSDDFSRSYPLRIRDLSLPERCYEGLFESRVEFAQARLGEDKWARQSRRPRAFLWPSMVRVGAEAQRLVGEQEGTETTSGLSSPKRYLWDTDPVQQDWRFHDHEDPDNYPKVALAAMLKLNNAGDVIPQVQADRRQKLPALSATGGDSEDEAVHTRFSHSALYGFMLQEVFAHAMVHINDPAARTDREQSDLPRRLRRVILTLPTATTMLERAIIKSRAEGALKLLWELQSQSKVKTNTWDPEAPPEIVVRWDEASCSQMVYLYSEIAKRFDGHIDNYLALRGRTRPRTQGGAEEPSIRVACVDIGGGTMDLMITTYYGEANKVLHPVQEFREGFRVAGDDLVRTVVSNILLPKLRASVEQSAEAHGDRARGVNEKLKELFGANVGGQVQQRVQQRRLCALRVLAPLAIALLNEAETADELDRLTVAAAEVLGRNHPASPTDTPAEASTEPATVELAVPSGVRSYLEDAMRGCGATHWRLADFEMTVSRREVDELVRHEFTTALGNMAEVVGHLDCDVVLLTGRPSRLPAVHAMMAEQLTVPPDRLVPLHSYRTGSWYPYRDPVTDRICDPKSTVVVGAMIMNLAQSRLHNFSVETRELQMKSTARFIGEMDGNGRILQKNVLFDFADDTGMGDQDQTVQLYTPMHIGFRQIELERWTTTPLYQLDFADHEIVNKYARPFAVKLEQRRDDPDEENPEAGLRRETGLELLRVTEVESKDGDSLRPPAVRLRLQTIGSEDEYWLDTGVFNVT